MIGGVGARVEANRSRFVALGRPSSLARAAWPEGAPGHVLALLLGLGVALRILACVSLWPTTILEDGYAPVLSGTYSGRYTVPMAGPLLAAAAIALVAMARQRSA